MEVLTGEAHEYGEQPVEEAVVLIEEAHASAEQPVEEAVVEGVLFLTAEAPGKQAQELLRMQLAALEYTQQ